MKQGIHPRYQAAVVNCACGNSWATRSTRAAIHTDICSQCHPFYTGEQRIVDTAGQVERFMRRVQNAQAQPRRKKVERREEALAQRRRQEELRRTEEGVELEAAAAPRRGRAAEAAAVAPAAADEPGAPTVEAATAPTPAGDENE